MQSGVPANTPSMTHRAIQQRILSAKKEVQKSKENTINESKMFLSKRVAEFEKEILRLQKSNQFIQNQLNLSVSEKEQMKLKMNQLRNQIKHQEQVVNDLNVRNQMLNQAP